MQLDMSLKKVYIELTDRCNLNCHMCYRQSWSDGMRDMSIETLDRLQSQLSKFPELKEIVLGGIGEPTVSELFQVALERFQAYEVTVTTNGQLIDIGKMEAIAQFADKLVVSVDGLEEMYYKIRGTQLSYVKTFIQTIQELKQQFKRTKPEIIIQFVLSTENQKDVLGVKDLAAELKAASMIISNLIPMTSDAQEMICYSLYENQELKQFFHKVRNEGFKRGLQIKFPDSGLKTERHCRVVEGNALFVCASGEVSPCMRLSHNYEEYIFGQKKQVKAHTFGNVNHVSKGLKEIWESPEMIRFRETVLYNLYVSCVDCETKDGCDYVKTTEMDCNGTSPGCGDCLWSRNIAYCV